MPKNRQIAKAGFLYFAIVFGVGFLLGTVRTLWIVPQVGNRIAELMEAPVMLVITIAAARWVVQRLGVPAQRSARLGMGAIALGLLLFAEFGLVSWLRGISVKVYLATRDSVSGTVYYLMLVLFGLMPLLVARKKRPRRYKSPRITQLLPNHASHSQSETAATHCSAEPPNVTHVTYTCTSPHSQNPCAGSTFVMRSDFNTGGRHAENTGYLA